MRIDLGPVLAAVVRDEQARTERPAVLQVQEPDLAGPVAPSGGPAAGARTAAQVRPPSPVRTTEVLASLLAPEPAWPITQPVAVPTNVTELGSKLPGTGSAVAPTAAVPADGAALVDRDGAALVDRDGVAGAGPRLAQRTPEPGSPSG